MLLSLNIGSSSIKFKLLDPKTRKETYKGMIDHLQNAFHAETDHKKIDLKVKKMADTEEQIERDIELILQIMNAEKVLGSKKLRGVVHRVVHGGEKYTDPIIINKKNLQDLEKLHDLAPLHNPYNISGIRAAQKHLKAFPHIAVFDTGFYKTLPEKAFRYAVPVQWYKKFGIRKYGFHGISHEYVTQETLKKLGKKNAESSKRAKIITCHLGNGCSITASIGGKAVDTSMGFTPLQGVSMATRSGDIDPAVIPHLMKKLKCSADEIIQKLNKESGLKAISETSGDMRIIYKQAQKNHKPSKRAIEIFCYQIAKYIGAFTAAMKGVDAITFTGGIGENAKYIRDEICSYLGKVKTFVIPTNEELGIAMKAEKLL